MYFCLHLLTNPNGREIWLEHGSFALLHEEEKSGGSLCVSRSTCKKRGGRKNGRRVRKRKIHKLGRKRGKGIKNVKLSASAFVRRIRIRESGNAECRILHAIIINRLMTHEQTSTLMICLSRGSRSPIFTIYFHSALSFRATFGLMNCICVLHTDSTSSSPSACRLYRPLLSFSCVVYSPPRDES